MPLSHAAQWPLSSQCSQQRAAVLVNPPRQMEFVYAASRDFSFKSLDKRVRVSSSMPRSERPTMTNAWLSSGVDRSGVDALLLGHGVGETHGISG